MHWAIRGVCVRRAWGRDRCAGERKLDGETAAFVVLHVEEFDGALGGFDGFEVDVAESMSTRHNISNCHLGASGFMCRGI